MAWGVRGMLFYEPFFALFVAPAFYGLYLIINDRALAKKWALIIASVAFYTWGEPLFVPVVVLEENEAALPGMKHSLEFRRIILGE